MNKNERKTRDEKRRLQLNRASSSTITEALGKVQGMNKRVLAVVLAIVMVLGLLPIGWFTFKGKAAELSKLGPVTMSVRANGANNYTTAEVPAGEIADHLGLIDFKNELPNGVQYYKSILVDHEANTETDISSVGSVTTPNSTKTYYGITQNSDTGSLLKDSQELVLVYAAKYQVTLNTSAHGTATTSALTDEEEDIDYVWGGNSLRIQAKADKDYYLDSVTYQVGDGSVKTASVNNGAATIPANDITDNLIVNVSFAPVSEYTISEVQNMSKSDYYPDLVGVDNHGGLTTGDGAGGAEGADAVSPGNKATFYVYSESNTGGSNFVFNMLSVNGVDIDYPTVLGQSEETPFRNGTVKVTLEKTDTALAWKGESTTAIIGAKHRSLYKVEITDVHENLEIAFNFKQKADRQIIIKGLQGIAETGSMAERRGLTMYFHPLTGGNIDDNWSLFPAGTRNYTFNTSKNNIYPAYFNDFDTNAYDEGITNISRWFMSAGNVYLYRVKPGYNPYSVKNQNVRAVYYDDNGVKTADLYGSDLLAGNSAAGRPEEVIRTAADNIDAQIDAYIEENGSDWSESQKNTIRSALRTVASYDSMLRFWGKSSVLQYNGTVLSRRNFNESSRTPPTELALTTLDTIEKADSTKRWYAVALEQNEANNQQLYLNADPYNYSLQLETGTGTISAPGYTPYSIQDINGNVYIEDVKHTIEDNHKYFVVPNAIPTKGTDYIFQGWQLVDAEGTPIEGYYFESNEQVPMNDLVLAAAYASDGDYTEDDLTIRLQADFEEISHASIAKVSSTTYYQDPDGTVTIDGIQGKTYIQRAPVESVQPVGEETALLNTYEPTPIKYYELNNASHLSGTVQAQETASVIPEENQFRAIYDLKLYDFSLKKELFGRTKYSNFDISLRLTRPSDYPFTAAETARLISLADDTGVTRTIDADTIVYSNTFSDGETLIFSGIPYGWNFEVIENKQTGDDSDTFITSIVESGKRTKQEGDTFTGTVTENTNLIVTNQRSSDDPNIVSDKWIEKEDGGDTYKLTMETYAIGSTITDTTTDPVPMDIALVIDQSGSMGTKDVNPAYVSTGVKDWTVTEATSGETYYYKVGNKYYPVQAQEGQLYEAVSDPVYIYQMIGRGHDGLTVGVNGSPVHFNVPTKYYAVDANDKIHKVYVITVGEAAQYAANTYYYTNNDTALPVHTNNNLNGGNVLVNENHPYNTGAEWTENIYWASISLSDLANLDGLWNSSNLYKTTAEDVYLYYGGSFVSAIGRVNKGWHVVGTTYTDSNYVKEATLFNGSHRWRSLAYNNQVCFVGENDASINSANSNMMHYSWISNGTNANANHDLYLPKDGINYNALYYVDDNGVKQPIGSTVDIASATAYHGELYAVRGTETRVSALQSAVADFTAKVAENAKESGVDHRIAIIGFAGNQFPAISTGDTAYNTTKYDYTDTGLFLNNTFKNYETITGYNQVSQKYINLHYYTTANGENPVYYSGGKWKYLHDGSEYTGNNFYEPVYADLSASDYQAALVEASQKDGNEFTGAVNTNLTNAIANFGYYGGTYTSYGMHMANQLFDNNTSTYEDSQGNIKQRRRLIIVFTDGEPGANGYNSSIAGEALADGNKATYSLEDGGVGATVYTIGLFPGNASSEVTSFMEQLSSKYTLPATNVYAAANVLDGGTRNAANNYGAGELDPDRTYYYEDTDGKTYAVTTQKDGLSTLGWWSYSGNSYIHRYPKTGSNDTRTINGEPVSTFYNSNGNPVYEANLDLTETYYSSSSTRNESTAIRYEYRWFNSNNRVREPKIDANGNGIQFFELGSPIQNDDGKQYYYEVKETKALTAAFATAFETIVTESTRLESRASLIRDEISDYFTFDATDNPHYKVELIGGSQTSSDADIEFDGPVDDITLSTDVSFTDNVLTYKGFDFSQYYIAPNHDGKKVRITFYGLKPTDAATGGIFESNAGDSGVCKLLEDENGQISDNFKLIDAFPKPSISRYKYTIDVDGDDETASYGTAFTVLDGNGNPLSNSATLYEQMKHAVTLNNEFWIEDPGTVQNTEGNRQRSIILEEIQDVDQFEVKLEGLTHGDDVPDNYQLRYTVTGANMDDVTYDYTKRINNGNTEPYDVTQGNPFTGVMLKDQDTTVHISSEELKTTVTIQEITQAMDPNNDFSDPTKEFDVILTLKDRSGEDASGYTYGDLEFDHNGTTTIKMKHNDAKTFEIPIGYSLDIDVKESTQDGYVDSYRENGTDKEGASYSSGPISAYTSIQVINKIDAPTVTGFLDNEKSYGLILGIAAGVSVAAAAAYLFIRRRKVMKA